MKALLLLALAACTDPAVTDDLEQEVSSTYLDRANAATTTFTTAIGGVVRDSTVSVGKPVSSVQILESRKNTVGGGPSGASYMVFVAKPFATTTRTYPAGLYELAAHADRTPALYFWGTAGRSELPFFSPPPGTVPSDSDPFGVCEGLSSSDPPWFLSKCLGFHVCTAQEYACWND